MHVAGSALSKVCCLNIIDLANKFSACTKSDTRRPSEQNLLCDSLYDDDYFIYVVKCKGRWVAGQVAERRDMKCLQKFMRITLKYS